MVFDISLGEFVVIGAAAFLLLGRKQMSAGAYVVGKGMGRAVGFVNRGREAVENVVSSQELSLVNSELSEGFRQFSNVRRELQSMRVDPVFTVKSAILSSQNKQATDTMHRQKIIQPASDNKKSDAVSQTSNQFGSSSKNNGRRPEQRRANFQHNFTPSEVVQAYSKTFLNLDQTKINEQISTQDVPGPKAARRYVDKSTGTGKMTSETSPLVLSEGVDIVLESLEELRLLEEYEKFAGLHKETKE